MNRSQGKDTAKRLLAPTLSRAFCAKCDNGFGGAFGDAAVGGMAIRGSSGRGLSINSNPASTAPMRAGSPSELGPSRFTSRLDSGFSSTKGDEGAEVCSPGAVSNPSGSDSCWVSAIQPSGVTLQNSQNTRA